MSILEVFRDSGESGTVLRKIDVALQELHNFIRAEKFTKSSKSLPWLSSLILVYYF